MENSVGVAVEGSVENAVADRFIFEEGFDGQHGDVESLFDLLPSELSPGFSGRHGERGGMSELGFLFGTECECGSEEIDGSADADFFSERVKGFGFGGSDAFECPSIEVPSEPVAIGDGVGLSCQPIEFISERPGHLKAIGAGGVFEHASNLVGLVPDRDLGFSSSGEAFDVGFDGCVVDLDPESISFAVKQFTEHNIFFESQRLPEALSDHEVILCSESGPLVDGGCE